MKKFLVASVVVASVVILAASKSSAQTIAAWDVAGHGTPFDATLVAGTSDLNLSAVPSLGRVGVLGNSAGNSFGSTNWNNTASFDQNNSYISFTVTPTGGYQLNLADLRYSVNGSNTLPNQGQWGYSDGGASFVLQSAFGIPFGGGALATWNFADFSTVNSVEFRFWAWGTTSINGAATSLIGGSGRIFDTTGNDLVLDGTTSAIPPCRDGSPAAAAPPRSWPCAGWAA